MKIILHDRYQRFGLNEPITFEIPDGVQEVRIHPGATHAWEVTWGAGPTTATGAPITAAYTCAACGNCWTGVLSDIGPRCTCGSWAVMRVAE